MNNQGTERQIIWSDINLDIEDWREEYKDYFEINELEDDPTNENAIYEWMYEKNGEHLDEERFNLNIQMSQEIIVIADLGLWNGRHMGYKEISSGNIKDCLYSNTDYTEWYVDKYGDLRADAIHHDGTNHYLYRVYKDSATETQRENFKEKIFCGKVTRADINRVTKRLGDEIGKIYGWDFPQHKQTKERSER